MNDVVVDQSHLLCPDNLSSEILYKLQQQRFGYSKEQTVSIEGHKYQIKHIVNCPCNFHIA